MDMVRDLRKTFQQFAKFECEGSSRLYEVLSYQIAADEDLLKIVAQIPIGQPVPNLLFASVQYLLKNLDDPLKEFYRSFTIQPKPADGAFEPFKRFVLSHQQALLDLFKSKLVQTNEVRRCTYLYPMLCEIYEKHQQPLALVEIGTSSALQLGIDQYQYQYGNLVVGNEHSELRLMSENRGESLPSSIKQPILVNTRIGMDLNTIDIQDSHELEWLQSLIWPEHTERLQFLKDAARIVNTLPIQLINGDATKELINVYLTIPNDEMLVVFHTHVANQFSQEAKESLVTALNLISKERPLYHIYNNLYDTNIHQDYMYDETFEEVRLLERADGHARWFKWKN